MMNELMRCDGLPVAKPGVRDLCSAWAGVGKWLGVLVGVLLWIRCETVLVAATWYVDNAAIGLRNGTSWANAWTNLNGIAGVSPGDTVYISGGTASKTYRDPYWSPKGGNAGNPITYKIGQESGHNGLAVFDGAANGNASFLYGSLKNLVVSGEYNGETRFITTNCLSTAIHLDFASDVVLDHIIVGGTMRFNPGTNITLSHLTIRPPPLTSASLVWTVFNPASAPESFTNNIIRNCTFLLPCNNSTPAWGADGIVGGKCSSVYSNTFKSYYYTDPTELESGRHADGWQAYGLGHSWCQIYANRFENIANYAIFWEPTGNVTNVWIFNNVFCNTDTFAHANQYSVGIVFGERSAGSTLTNILIANNTVVDYFGLRAISLGDDPGESSTWLNIVVANNLTYNSGKAGSASSINLALTSGGTNGVTIVNNKAIAGTRGSSGVTPSQLVYPGGGASVQFLSYGELSPENNFRLGAGDSAATGQGANLFSIFSKDADGKSRPSSGAWTIGAFENANSGPDVTPPVLSPAATSSLSTNSAVITWTSDEAATSIVEYGLSSAYGAVFTNLTLSTSHTVPIGGLSPGATYHYRVSSADAAGNVATSSDFVFTTLAPDTTAPVVSLTAPASAAVVGGSTALTATASDDVGVAGVQFMVDGLVIGAEDTAAPYSLVWDTTVVTNGAHIVQALARDTSGNTNTSAAVSFVVQNEIGTNLVNGLVGYWAFEEGKGLRAYPVANYGKEAALLGGASWVPGRAGSALLLDGIDGRAEVVDSPALRLNGSLTLALWVKHSTLPALGENMHYLEKGLEDHDNYGFGLGNSAQGMRLYLEFEDSTGAYRRFRQSGNLVPAIGAWVHVAVVFDDANDVARFYANGVEVGSAAVAQSPNGLLTNPILIGSENFAGWEWHLHGAVDGLRIYNRNLSAAEISGLYALPPFPVPSLLHPVGP